MANNELRQRRQSFSLPAKEIETYLKDVADGKDVEECAKTMGKTVAEQVELAGIAPLHVDGALEMLCSAWKDKKVGAAAFIGLAEILASTDHTVEPLVIPCLHHIIDAWADKEKRTVLAAEKAAEKIVLSMRKWAVGLVVPMLIENAMGGKAKPAQKEMALKLIKVLAEHSPAATGRQLVILIPVVADLMWEIKKEVKVAALAAMEAIIMCSGNQDLTPFIPVVLNSIKDPKTVPDSVEKLAGCVFVQNVEAPALACVVPVLVRGLNERSEETKRKCCVIIDNMCKLVDNPKEVLPLMPKLKPLVEKNKESISNPEARTIAEKAFTTLTKSAGDIELQELTCADGKKVLMKCMDKKSDCPGLEKTLEYVGSLIAVLTNGQCFTPDVWNDEVTLFLNKFYTDSEAAEIMTKVLELCEVEEGEDDDFVEDDEGVDLYKGTFSLAYGSLTLLNNTKLHLKRNKFYGLLGPNNCGKTTLMRAIANEQVEGFPKRDELRTIFVEHEIQEREVGEDENRYPILNIDLCGIDWVVDTCNNVYSMSPPVTRDQVIVIMEDIGFGNFKRDFGKDRAADCEMGVTTYSGGWKMKMQLCAATLMNADILMLDEPTGHLDVKNIAWIKDWLQQFKDKGGSVIATSHDSSFLNDMCTHIIDFQDRKLKMFKGDKGVVLKQFVEKHPEKQSYFELRNDVVKFNFPKPGPLDGVKSRTKTIMKMTNVTFQYPTRDTPTVFDINLQVNQVSRVAVIGPNGAGKSTAIKLLTGELKPWKGSITQHPNMRLAYVAQHAFHHLEKHLVKTPIQYIMWRFAGNEDKESLEFRDEAGDYEEDEKLQAIPWFLDAKQSNRLRKCEEPSEEKHRVIPEAILKRRDNKKEKTKEYEVKWQFKPLEASTWEDRNTLVRMGYTKMVQRQDEKEAAAAGLMTKQLTQQAIEKHLNDFGIDPEAASHTLIQSLSGGQKVKVVIAASMWQNPHIVILDEPTNYLDRDGLGALTHAIEQFEGGVIIISHNREFANAVSQEKWIMEAGRLRAEGESVLQGEEGGADAAPDEIIDASGNVIKVNKLKEGSDKEKKQELKNIEKKLKDHAKKKYLSEEEYWELKDRQVELKEFFDAEKAAKKSAKA